MRGCFCNLTVLLLLKVLDTKSTKNLPAPMAVVTVLNCSLWGTFGLFIINDPFIYGPNILGLASGLTQCALLAKFGIYKAPPGAPKEEEANDGPVEKITPTCPLAGPRVRRVVPGTPRGKPTALGPGGALHGG